MRRRAWDAYLVPRGKGSRIPTHFVDPPTREWTERLFVVNQRSCWCDSIKLNQNASGITSENHVKRWAKLPSILEVSAFKRISKNCMMRAVFIACLILLRFGSWGAITFSTTFAFYTEDGPVTILTEKNFKELVLNSGDVWMVEFFAPWVVLRRGDF